MSKGIIGSVIALLSLVVGTVARAMFGVTRDVRKPLDSDVAPPVTDVHVVDQSVGKPRSSVRPYMTTGMRKLLALIRKHEAGDAGYNADFANDDRMNLVGMSVSQARDFGRSQVTRDGEPSSAIGAYQFLTKTLDSLISSLGLNGREPFDEAMQDDLAVALMIRRGRSGSSAVIEGGKLIVKDPIAFANALAKEWASLPVVTNMRGAHRQLKRGQSYYSGDGLNRSHHDPDVVLAAVRALSNGG